MREARNLLHPNPYNIYIEEAQKEKEKKTEEVALSW